MASFLEKLRTGWDACGVRKRDAVLLGVSGGADSVALMSGTHAILPDVRFRVIVAHYNHKLRGAESDGDAEWVRQHGACHAEEVVVESAQEPSPGVAVSEESARTARYQFLTDAALEHDCKFVAVAHTADDQAETILHHILRGTGIAGLRGIPRSRELATGVTLVRPLLETPRKDLIEWLVDHNQSYRTDSTNEELRFTRNRIRHSLLPQLAAEFNPQIVQALLKLGRQVAETDEALKELAVSALRQCDPQIAADGNECVLNVGRIAALPRHVLRAMFVRLWTELNWPRQKMDYRAWDVLAGLVERAGELVIRQQRVELPGNVLATQIESMVKLVRRSRNAKTMQSPHDD